MILQKNVKTGAASAKNPLSEEITFKFISDSVLKAFEKDGQKYCRLTASSNGEDLVGDVMSEKALGQMKAAAVGTVMFMNHSTNVPEDVFGTVIEATLEPKKAGLVGGGESELYCLDYLVEVQDDNERALKTWQMIEKGTKLGASVTVLVRDKSPNPKRNKGIVIDDVEYLETSIVGIPCNRQSWVNSAKKALELAEKRAAKTEGTADEPDETAPEETGEPMSKENNAPAKQAAIITPEVNAGGTVGKFFPLTLAAITAYKSVRAQIEAKATTVELPETVAEIWRKGMFNDILAQKPSFWDLCDILSAVRWKLQYQAENLRYLGQTDFSEIQAAWAEAIDEFKTAQIDSFNYWAKLEAMEPAAEDALEDDDEIAAYSLEIEKSFESLAEVFSKTTGEDARGQLRETGGKLLEFARKMGIVTDTGADEDVQLPEPSPEQIEKSAGFVELKEKLAAAEGRNAELQKQLDETAQNYEIAKAGLKAATAALENNLRQPMNAAQGTSATS